MRLKVKFKKWHCYIQEKEYENGRLALLLRDRATHEPIAKATVNIPREEPGEGCVWIKNWSENEGILEALKQAGIVEPTGLTIPVGRAYAHEARYLGGQNENA